jgi:hypothetical protein
LSCRNCPKQVDVGITVRSTARKHSSMRGSRSVSHTRDGQPRTGNKLPRFCNCSVWPQTAEGRVGNGGSEEDVPPRRSAGQKASSCGPRTGSTRTRPEAIF